MPWGEIGAVLVVLVVVFAVGKLWFHIAEGITGGLKRLISRREPPAWHTLPSEQEEEKEEHV